MKHYLIKKLIAIFAVTILVLIPICLISSLIDERDSRHQEVKQDIAKSSSKSQKLIGPFIYVSYWHTEEKNEKEVTHLIQQFILPDEFNLSGSMNTFAKKRGIYSALLYRSNANITGQFSTESLHTILDKDLESLNLVMAVSDMRGIGVNTQILLNQQEKALQPGTDIPHFSDGVHVELNPNWFKQNHTFNFDIQLDLLGMESLQIVPIGNKSKVSIEANWPHPSFNGEYLPIESNITNQGFNAHWQTSYFATNMQQLAAQCFYQSDCHAFQSRSLGVNLIEPVDHYLKSHRAVNYALMIIALVFASFFLLEVIREQPIHPIQYGFVGLALALFYLLLLSLSEHLGFNIAYIISAGASITLLASYVTSILNNKAHSLLFGVALICLYTLMYILLGAEDYALLLGSVLIFSVLAFIMLLTKNLNWYSSGQKHNPTSD